MCAIMKLKQCKGESNSRVVKVGFTEKMHIILRKQQGNLEHLENWKYLHVTGTKVRGVYVPMRRHPHPEGNGEPLPPEF